MGFAQLFAENQRLSQEAAQQKGKVLNPSAPKARTAPARVSPACTLSHVRTVGGCAHMHRSPCCTHASLAAQVGNLGAKLRPMKLQCAALSKLIADTRKV